MNAVVPVPVATAVPQVVPSLETKTWYPRGKLVVVVPASNVSWLKVWVDCMST